MTERAKTTFLSAGAYRIRPMPPWVPRLCRWALAGPFFAMHLLYLPGTGISLQHVLYALAGAGLAASVLLRAAPRLSRWVVFVASWFVLAVCVSLVLSSYRPVIAAAGLKVCAYVLAATACGMTVAHSPASVRKFVNLLIAAAIFNSVVAIVQAATGWTPLFSYLLPRAALTQQLMGWGRSYAALPGTAGPGVFCAPAAAAHFAARWTPAYTYALGAAWRTQEHLGVERVSGMLSSPNILAIALLIPMSVMLARVLDSPGPLLRLRPLGGWVFKAAALALMAASLLLSSSRIGGLAAAVACLLVVGRRLCRPRLLAWGAVATVALSIVVALLVPESTGQLMVRLTTVRDLSFVERSAAARVAWREVPKRLIVGMGLYGFREVSGGYAVHLGVLEPFVELGIVGWVPAMLAVGGAVVFAWRCARRGRSAAAPWLWRGLAAGATGLFLADMAHGSGWRDPFLWGIMGLGAVAAAHLRSAGGRTDLTEQSDDA